MYDTTKVRVVCVYLLRLAHGSHWLSVMTDVPPVPRTDAADRGATDEAVETSRLVEMVGTARVRRPKSHLHLSTSVDHRRQLVARSVAGFRMSARVTDVQLAVCAHPRRRSGGTRL